MVDNTISHWKTNFLPNICMLALYLHGSSLGSLVLPTGKPVWLIGDSESSLGVIKRVNDCVPSVCLVVYLDHRRSWLSWDLVDTMVELRPSTRLQTSRQTQALLMSACSPADWTGTCLDVLQMHYYMLLNWQRSRNDVAWRKRAAQMCTNALSPAETLLKSKGYQEYNKRDTSTVMLSLCGVLPGWETFLCLALYSQHFLWGHKRNPSNTVMLFCHTRYISGTLLYHGRCLRLKLMLSKQLQDDWTLIANVLCV